MKSVGRVCEECGGKVCEECEREWEECRKSVMRVSVRYVEYYWSKCKTNVRRRFSPLLQMIRRTIFRNKSRPIIFVNKT